MNIFEKKNYLFMSFATLRTLFTFRHRLLCLQPSSCTTKFDRYLDYLLISGPSAANSRRRHAARLDGTWGQTDRRTDGRTLDHFIVPASHYASSVDKIWQCRLACFGVSSCLSDLQENENSNLWNVWKKINARGTVGFQNLWANSFHV